MKTYDPLIYGYQVMTKSTKRVVTLNSDRPPPPPPPPQLKMEEKWTFPFGDNSTESKALVMKLDRNWKMCHLRQILKSAGNKERRADVFRTFE